MSNPSIFILPLPLPPPIVDPNLKRGDGRSRQETYRGDKIRKTCEADNIVRQRMLLGDITRTVHTMTQLLVGVHNGLVEAHEKMLRIQHELRVLQALSRVGQMEGGLG